MSILRAIWRIVIGAECDWYECARPGWKIRVDHGGTRFVLCAEHAVEGKHRNYWRGGPLYMPSCSMRGCAETYGHTHATDGLGDEEPSK
jgi:hypothetical protein